MELLPLICLLIASPVFADDNGSSSSERKKKYAISYSHGGLSPGRSHLSRGRYGKSSSRYGEPLGNRVSSHFPGLGTQYGSGAGRGIGSIGGRYGSSIGKGIGSIGGKYDSGIGSGIGSIGSTYGAGNRFGSQYGQGLSGVDAYKGSIYRGHGGNTFGNSFSGGYGRRRGNLAHGFGQIMKANLVGFSQQIGSGYGGYGGYGGNSYNVDRYGSKKFSGPFNNRRGYIVPVYSTRVGNGGLFGGSYNNDRYLGNSGFSGSSLLSGIYGKSGNRRFSGNAYNSRGFGNGIFSGNAYGQGGQGQSGVYTSSFGSNRYGNPGFSTGSSVGSNRHRGTFSIGSFGRGRNRGNSFSQRDYGSSSLTGSYPVSSGPRSHYNSAVAGYNSNIPCGGTCGRGSGW